MRDDIGVLQLGLYDPIKAVYELRSCKLTLSKLVS